MKAWLRVFDQYGDNMLERPRLVEARRRANGHYLFEIGYARLDEGSAVPVSGWMLVQLKTGRPIKKQLYAPSVPWQREIYLGSTIYAPTPTGP